MHTKPPSIRGDLGGSQCQRVSAWQAALDQWQIGRWSHLSALGQLRGVSSVHTGVSKPREHDVVISFSSPTTPSGRVVRDWSKSQDLEPGRSLGLGSFHPPCGLCNELGTPWTQEEWGQGQGPESLGVKPTYRNDLRAFHLPWTWMEESEMDRLRPWPGRAVKAEPSSSQLRMSRLRRETRRVASASAWVQPQQGSCSHLCTFPSAGTGPAELLQVGVWVCAPLTEHLLCAPH